VPRLLDHAEAGLGATRDERLPLLNNMSLEPLYDMSSDKMREKRHLS
jgi:hypothetical protein